MIRRAKRSRSGEPARLALEECAALLGLERYREVLLVATRALGRSTPEVDLRARLRVARGEALWRGGRARAGEQEAQRALAEAQEPHTRARALELLGSIAWRQQSLSQAREHLESAQELYAARRSASGLFRVFGTLAYVLRDQGRPDAALALQQRRLALALELQRPDLSALARAERGAVLAALGHWRAARADLDTASEMVERLARDNSAWIEPARAALDLAGGNLAGARSALARVSSAGCSHTAAEVLVMRSDLDLASGKAREAEECAGEALRLFTARQDREGSCRSRLRRGLALIEQGRCPDAIREARRVRAAAAPASGLLGLALLVEGRALLRLGRPATRVFAQAREVVESPFREAAELGMAVAEGGTWACALVQRPLAALVAWGDRRLLSYALADLRATLGPQKHQAGAAPGQAPQRADPKARAVAEVAVRLLGPEPLGERWRTAMTALHPILPWWRAVLLGPQDLELRWDLQHPQPLPGGDLARELAAAAKQPLLLDLGPGTPFADHPTSALHGLRSAVLAPAGDGGCVCFDFREAEPGPEAVALATEVAGLIGRMQHEVAFPEVSQTETPQFPGLIGRSAALRELCRGIVRVAGAEAPVHILGETGAGKERVAEAIHQTSRRRHGPFVAVNSPSLTDELFDSQLFGHVKGAFTGAVSDREGHVVQAEGGTLFLDEIVDLSPKAQAGLLRFLETGEYRRMGETCLRRAKARIVTASNASLEERVKAGQLRGDLLYRLKRLTLSVPPLRERAEDILLLARHFLRQAAAEAGVAAPALSPAIEKALLAHSWPGNVRELRNEMEQLCSLAPQGPLRREQLSPSVLAASTAGAGSGATACWSPAPLREVMSACERDHIARVLETTSGNRAQAACALGLTRQALFAKINRLGIG